MRELDNRLWDILNRVRGHRDVSDLKEILISLLFLKCANDRFVPNSYNAIEVPKDAQWNYMHKIGNASNFIDVLQKSFLSLERENHQLENTFSVFDFNYKFKTKEDIELFRYLFESITDFGFSDDPLDFSILIKNLLITFAKNEGKRGDDFTTPDSVSQLMIELLNPEKGVVLDSACGTGGFFQQIEDNYPNGEFQFYGQELNSSTLAIAKLRFALNQKNAIHFGEAKSTLDIDQFPDLKADYVIMHPPFNVKSWTTPLSHFDTRFEFGIPPKSNANFVWIQHAISHLNSDGKAALLLNNGALSSGGKEGEIRKRLIEADIVEAIITLPSQLLANTSIPSSIWIFNKNKLESKKVIFIDASNLGEVINKGKRELSKGNIQEIVTQYSSWQKGAFHPDWIGFSNSVDLKRIAENDFILLPARYLSFSNITGVDLSNAISLGEILKYVTPTNFEMKENTRKLSVKDLSSSPDSYIIKSENLSEQGLKHNYRLLQNDVLLLSRLGQNIKPSFYTSSTEHVAYSSNNIYAFKVDENRVLLDYLIAELHKEYIQFQLDGYSMGSAMQSVRRQDLLKILILIPTLKEQQKEIFEREREIRFQTTARDLGFEKEIAKLKLAQMKDLGSKKHNIMQHLNNVKASADVLTKMMELNNGVLKSEEIIDPRRGVTVAKRFLRLQESLGKVIYYVDNITNELSYDETEIINPVKFINECKERGLQNELFSLEIIFEKATFEGREPFISISKNDFEEIYNNILENAINHGFIDNDKIYIFRITISFIDDFLEINFENNGKPFPKGIAQKFDVKGEKAGATAGTGIGLWKVSEIAKHFDVKMSVFDEPKSDFPIGFNFKFNPQTL